MRKSGEKKELNCRHPHVNFFFTDWPAC